MLKPQTDAELSLYRNDNLGHETVYDVLVRMCKIVKNNMDNRTNDSFSQADIDFYNKRTLGMLPTNNVDSIFYELLNLCLKDQSITVKRESDPGQAQLSYAIYNDKVLEAKFGDLVLSFPLSSVYLADTVRNLSARADAFIAAEEAKAEKLAKIAEAAKAKAAEEAKAAKAAEAAKAEKLAKIAEAAKAEAASATAAASASA